MADERPRQRTINRPVARSLESRAEAKLRPAAELPHPRQKRLECATRLPQPLRAVASDFEQQLGLLHSQPDRQNR